MKEGIHGGCEPSMGKQIKEETKMNKTFKRALSSVLAAAMTVSSMTVATVTSALPFTAVSAFAADETVASWKYSDGMSAFPDAFGAVDNIKGLTTTYTLKSSAKATYTDGFLGTSPFSVANQTGVDLFTISSTNILNGSGTAIGAKYCLFIPTVTGTMNLYVVNSGATDAKTNSIRIFKSGSGLTVDNGTYSIPDQAANDGQFDVPGHSGVTEISPVAIPVTKDTPICVYFNNSKTVCFGATLVASADTTTTTTTTTTTETTTEATTTTTEATTAAAFDTSNPDNLIAMKAPSEGYAADQLVYEDEYAQVYAAQKLVLENKTGSVFGLNCTANFRTSKVNTATDTGSYRLAFKVVAKKDTRIYTAGSSNTKNAIFLYDGKTYTNVTGNKAAAEEFHADITAGQTAYIGNGGTDSSMLAVIIKKGPVACDVSTKVTLGDAATALTSGSVTVDGTAYTVTDGTLAFTGKTATSYTVTYTADGVTYTGTLTVAEDGTMPATINLPVSAADGAITVQTADGTKVANKKVVLTYKVGTKPVVTYATTNADGVVTFPGLAITNAGSQITYTVEVGGYTTTDTFAPTEGALSKTITVTAKTLPALPSGASNDNLYVGYASSDSITAYDFIQDAVDAAAAGKTIYVAPGTYNEDVEIWKAVTIKGEDNAAATTVISYCDGANGNNTARSDAAAASRTDSVASKASVRFHGETVYITVDSGEVNIENITIQNTNLKDDPKVNAGVISAYIDNQNVTVNLTNCVLDANCDTVYTGKKNATNTWNFTNCDINGFQDVVCGSGTAALDNCTWNVNYNSTARLLVPQTSTTVTSKMTANNLTVNYTGSETFDSSKNYIYLGRAWGSGTTKVDGVDVEAPLDSVKAVVNVLTDNTGLIDVENYGGYDTGVVGTALKNAPKTVDKLDYTDSWTTDVDGDGTTVYYTSDNITLTDNDGASILEFVAGTGALDKDNDKGYLFQAAVADSTLANAIEAGTTDATAIGYAVYDGDTYKGMAVSDTVYKVAEDGKLYAVDYIKVNGTPTDAKIYSLVEYGTRLFINTSDAGAFAG